MFHLPFFFCSFQTRLTVVTHKYSCHGDGYIVIKSPKYGSANNNRKINLEMNWQHYTANHLSLSQFSSDLSDLSVQ